MKANFKITEKPELAKTWEIAKVGKNWEVKGKHRFYINQDILSYCVKSSNMPAEPFGLEHSGLFIDIKECCFSHNGLYNISEEQLKIVDLILHGILDEFKSKLGKISFSKWTKKDQKCNDIYHCIN